MTDFETQSLVEALDPCRKDSSLMGEGMDAPKFGEPWHAQVFGLAFALSKAGHFTRDTWVDTFSKEIKANPQRSDESSEDAYYRQWAAALFGLLESLEMMNDAEMAEAVEAWRRSFLHTDHGKPIVFRRDLPKPDYDHVDHHHHHAPTVPPQPVSVSEPLA